MPLPSQRQLRMLVSMYPDKVIGFEDQALFKTERVFREEMQKLAKWDRVIVINGISSDMRNHVERYKLSFNGGVICEFFENYAKRNGWNG